MDASNLQTSFGPVLRTFLLFCMTALCPRQLLFILREELGIPVGMPIRGDHHRLQAQVKPNLLRGHFQWLDVLFYQERDKVAFSFIFGDGDTPWLASIGQGTVPDDGKGGIHLRKREGTSIPSKSIACIGSSLLMTLLFEGGIRSPSFKEVAKGLIEMSERLLEHNRRNLVQPKRLFLLLEADQA